MDNKIWLPVPKYENLYEISDSGDLRSFHQRSCNRREYLKGWTDNNGYIVYMLCKEGTQKKIRAHVLVAMAFLGYIPNGVTMVVDHINNIKSDNRLINLRIVTQRENCSKKRDSTASKYIGVTKAKNRNKWMASINIKGKQINLGSYVHEKDASDAYNSALNKLNENIEVTSYNHKYTSDYKGVHWSKNLNRWVAQFYISAGKRKYLGVFKEEYDAHLAHENYAKEYYKTK